MPQHVKITPGAEFTIPTVAEFTDPVNSLLAKLGQNARMVREIKQTTSDGAGNFSIQVGPPDGFIWSVMLATVDPGNGTGTWTLYLNGVNPLAKLCALQTGNATVTFSKSQVVLKGNDVLIVASTAVGAVNYPTGIMLAAIEVPYAHEAQLLL